MIIDRFGNMKLMRRIFAFSFISLGLGTSILNKSLVLRTIEARTNEGLFMASLLFLFVEIILIVCGAALLILENVAPRVD